MVKDWVAPLIGNPDSCELQFGRGTLALPMDAGGNARFSALGRSVISAD